MRFFLNLYSSSRETAKWPLHPDGAVDQDLSEVGVNIVDVAGNKVSGKFDGAKLLKLRGDGKWLQLADKGEINMDSKTELEAFMRTVLKDHPGDKRALTFWNHGGGFAGFGGDNDNKKDGADGFAIKHIKESVSKVLAEFNVAKLDLLSFDACLMSSYISIVEFKELAHFYLASEDLEPGHGYDWSTLKPINSGRVSTPVEYARAIVDGFMAITPQESPKTQCITDMAAVDALVTSMNTLLEYVRQGALKQYVEIIKPWKAGVLASMAIDGSFSEKQLVDLGDMLAKVKAANNNICAQLEVLIDDALAKYAAAVEYEIDGEPHNGFTGYHMYMPPSRVSDSAYEHAMSVFDSLELNSTAASVLGAFIKTMRTWQNSAASGANPLNDYCTAAQSQTLPTTSNVTVDVAPTVTPETTWSMGAINVTNSTNATTGQTTWKLDTTLSTGDAVEGGCIVGIMSRDYSNTSILWTGSCDVDGSGNALTATWGGIVRALVQFAPPAGANPKEAEADAAKKKPRTFYASEDDPFFSVISADDDREENQTTGVITLKSTVLVNYYPGSTNKKPPCNLTTAVCTRTNTTADGRLVITQTYDKYGIKLSPQPSYTLYANLASNKTTANFAQVATASGGFIVPVLHVSTDKAQVDAGAAAVTKVLGDQYFVWGNPKVVGALKVLEFDIDPASRVLEPFFDTVYFSLDATDINGRETENTAFVHVPPGDKTTAAFDGDSDAEFLTALNALLSEEKPEAGDEDTYLLSDALGASACDCDPFFDPCCSVGKCQQCGASTTVKDIITGESKVVACTWTAFGCMSDAAFAKCNAEEAEDLGLDPATNPLCTWTNCSVVCTKYYLSANNKDSELEQWNLVGESQYEWDNGFVEMESSIGEVWFADMNAGIEAEFDYEDYEDYSADDGVGEAEIEGEDSMDEDEWTLTLTPEEIAAHESKAAFVPGSCKLRPEPPAAAEGADTPAKPVDSKGQRGADSVKAMVGWYDYNFQFGSMDPEAFDIEVTEAEMGGDEDDDGKKKRKRLARRLLAVKKDTRRSLLAGHGANTMNDTEDYAEDYTEDYAEYEIEFIEQCTNLFSGEIKCWDDCKPLICGLTHDERLGFKQILKYVGFNVCAEDQAHFYCCGGETNTTLKEIGTVQVPPSPRIVASLAYEKEGLEGGKLTGASVTMMFLSVIEYEGFAPFDSATSKELSEMIIGRTTVTDVTTYNVDGGDPNNGIYKHIVLQAVGKPPVKGSNATSIATETETTGPEFIFQMDCYIGTREFARTDIPMQINIDESKCDLHLHDYPKTSNTSSLAIKTAVMAETYEESFNYEVEEDGGEGGGESKNVKLNGAKLDFAKQANVTAGGIPGVISAETSAFARCKSVAWYNRATAAYFEREFKLGNGLQCMYFSFMRPGGIAERYYWDPAVKVDTAAAKDKIASKAEAKGVVVTVKPAAPPAAPVAEPDAKAPANKPRATTSISLGGLKKVGEAEKTSIKNALANTLGVNASSIAVTKVTFPVTSTLMLRGVTVESVDKTALAAAIAKDLGVKTSDVAVVVTAARRRQLLATSGDVNVAVKVSNVESSDAAGALVLKFNVVVSSASSELAKAAKAAISVKTIATYGAEVEVEVVSATVADSTNIMEQLQAADVGTKLTASLKAEGITASAVVAAPVALSATPASPPPSTVVPAPPTTASPSPPPVVAGVVVTVNPAPPTTASPSPPPVVASAAPGGPVASFALAMAVAFAATLML